MSDYSSTRFDFVRFHPQPHVSFCNSFWLFICLYLKSISIFWQSLSTFHLHSSALTLRKELFQPQLPRLHCYFSNHEYGLKSFLDSNKAAKLIIYVIGFEIAVFRWGSSCWRQFFCSVLSPTLTTNHFCFTANSANHPFVWSYWIVLESILTG